MLKRVSATQIKSFRRCPSRWYNEKVLGHKPPETDAMRLGTKVHASLESYLVEGTELPDTREGKIAAPALELLPLAGSVPRAMSERRFTTSADFYGVPLVGVIDLVEGDRITDFKTTSDFKYAKTEEELRADIQAQVYALERVRLCREEGLDLGGNVTFRHVYVRTKGGPAVRTSEVELYADDLEDARTKIRADVARMRELAEVEPSKAADVPYTLEACNDFGGCPHRSRCASLGRHTKGVISTLFTDKGITPMETPKDPLAALLAARLQPKSVPINPPDGTPETELAEPPPVEVVEESPPEVVEEVTEEPRKRRALRLPGVMDSDGDEVLITRASKSELVNFAAANRIIVEPPEGRSKPGAREYRESIEAYLLFVGDDAPEVVETPTPTYEEPVEAVEDVAVSVATEGGFTLYLNATPRGAVTYLDAIVAPIALEVAEEAGEHYLTIAYNAGPKRVAAVVASRLRSGDLELTGAVVVDMRLPASEAVVDVLLPLASNVVRSF